MFFYYNERRLGLRLVFFNYFLDDAGVHVSEYIKHFAQQSELPSFANYTASSAKWLFPSFERLHDMCSVPTRRYLWPFQPGVATVVSLCLTTLSAR